MPGQSFGVKPLSSEAVSDFRAYHGHHERFNYTVGIHNHEHYEILLHGHGGTRLVVGRASYLMRDYDLYIIPPYYIHGIVTSEPLADYDRTWLHITPACLDSLGSERISFLLKTEALTARGNHRFPLERGDYERLQGMLEEVQQLKRSQSDYQEMKARLILGIFFNEMSRLLQPGSRDSGEDRQSSPVIQQVFSYIGENCTEDLSLDYLADRFNLSKYYLSHMFSRVYHVSTYRYIRMCRIAMAQRLIRSGDSMTNIAQRCGFNDYSNFLRSFQQITGVTPTAFLKKAERLEEPGRGGPEEGLRTGEGT